MKNVLRLLVLLACIAAAIWLWRWLFPSPERIITSRLEKLAAAATVNPGEGYLPRMAHAQTVASLCASNVEISIDLPHEREHSTRSRDEIVQGLTAAKIAAGLKVKFQDITVTVSADGTSAQADLTAEVQTSDEPDLIVQQIQVTLKKIDGQWVVTKARTVRPLS